MMDQKKSMVLVLLGIALVGMVVYATGSGAMYISPIQIFSIVLKKLGMEGGALYGAGQENVFWAIRLPRVIQGLLVGAALAISGAAMQGIYRNPLADPGLIGISSGASLSAVIAIVLLAHLPQFTGVWGYYLLNFITFGGAAAASVLVYSLSRSDGKT